MASKGASRLTSALDEHKALHSKANPPAIVDRPPMPDNEANAFGAAFNQGKTTFEGRLWTSLNRQYKAPAYTYTYTCMRVEGRAVFSHSLITPSDP